MEGGGTVDNVNAGNPDRDAAGITDMVNGAGDWGGWNGFNGINTGNKVMDVIIGGLFPGMGIIDRLAQVHIGDGVAGRGSSNNGTEQGAGAGGNEIADIIRTIVERGNEQQQQTPVTANPNARGEGGRRPGSATNGLMRFPNRSDGSTLRRGPPTRISNPPIMMDRKPGWENPPPDLEKMPRIINDMMPFSEVGGSGFRKINPQLFSDVPAPTGSVNQMLGPNAGTPPVDLSKMFSNILSTANQAVNDRSGGLNYAVGRFLDRGDITPDASSINMAVQPLQKQARSTALASMLGGTRVPDNLFDLSNLGAKIGARQGAQNVDVRRRIAPRR